MAGGWNEGHRPDGDTFYLIRAGQRDAAGGEHRRASIAGGPLHRRAWGGTRRTAPDRRPKTRTSLHLHWSEVNRGSVGTLLNTELLTVQHIPDEMLSNELLNMLTSPFAGKNEPCDPIGAMFDLPSAPDRETSTCGPARDFCKRLI